jgi:hypothetical protein
VASKEADFEEGVDFEEGGFGGCIPSYRLRFTFLHHVSVAAWFGSESVDGSVCFDFNRNPPSLVADLLADAGIAYRDEGGSAVDATAAADPSHPVCVRVNALAGAASEARAYIATQLRPIDRDFLLNHR